MAQSTVKAENTDFQQIALPLDLCIGEHVLQRTRLEADSTSIPQHLEQDELKEIYPGGNTESVVVSRIDAYARFSVREA